MTHRVAWAAMALLCTGWAIACGADDARQQPVAPEVDASAAPPDASTTGDAGDAGGPASSFPEGRAISVPGTRSSGDLNGVLVQPDGKIVVFGGVTPPSLLIQKNGRSTDALVMRFLPDGTLDATFGTNGVTLVPLMIGASGTPATFHDGFLQPDGKIVLLASNQALVRIMTSGALDPTFGSGGLSATIPGSFRNCSQRLVRHASGKVSVLSPGTDGGIVSLTADGALDGAPIALTSLPNGFAPIAFALDAADRFLVGGAAGFNEAFVARLDPNGGIDPTFGGGTGIWRAPYDRVTRIAPTQTGELLLGGVFPEAGLARLTSVGELDVTFGTGGIERLTPAGRFAGAPEAVHAAPDGRVTALFYKSGTGNLLTRRLANGAPDPTFAGGSDATLSISVPHSLTLDASGRILVVGEDLPDTPAEKVDARPAVTRLSSAGGLDGTFATTGTAAPRLLAEPEVVQGVTRLPDGKILAAGSMTWALRFARLNADGTIDTSYGDGGQVLSPFRTTLLVQPAADGRIYQLAEQPVRLRRFGPDGTHDTNWGNGELAVRPGLSAPVWPSLALDRAGRVLLFAKDVGGDPFVIRVTPGGALDAVFGDVNPGVAPPGALSVQDDGGILVAGWAGGQAVSVARITSNGRPDTSFVGPQWVGLDSISSVTPRAGGGALVAGTIGRWDSSAYELFVAATTPTGAADPSFGQGGLVKIPAGGNPRLGVKPNARLAPLPNGGAMLIGEVATSPNHHDVIAIRLSPNGTPDATFGTAGRLPIFASPGMDFLGAAEPLGDGSVLVGGALWSPVTGPDFAFFRLPTR